MSRKDYILLAILLSQILVESLFLLMPTIEGQRFVYFSMVKALKIGLLPSFYIFMITDNIYTKILSLTLILFNTFLLIIETLANVSSAEWMVTKLNEYDFLNFTLIITSAILSYFLNELLNRNNRFVIYFLLLLQKVKCLKK